MAGYASAAQHAIVIISLLDFRSWSILNSSEEFLEGREALHGKDNRHKNGDMYSTGMAPGTAHSPIAGRLLDRVVEIWPQKVPLWKRNYSFPDLYFLVF